MEIDLGGIAKGYTSNRIMEIFREYGVKSGLVNLGGNVQAKPLAFMGVEIDLEANKVRGEEAVISAAGSKVTVVVVPTDEELMIARDTAALVK